MPDPDELRKSYDRVAGDYAAEYADEMSKKAFDRRMLDWSAGVTGAASAGGCWRVTTSREMGIP